MPMMDGWIAEMHGRVGLPLKLSVGPQGSGIFPELTGIAATL